MSIKLMSAIFETEFPDILSDSEGNNIRASTAKLVLLAIADHANDYGESAYPGLTLLEKKTGLSRQGILDTIGALKFNGLLAVSDIPSRLGTNNYSIVLTAYPSLVNRVDQQESTGLGEVVNRVDLNHQLTINESSIDSLKTKKPTRQKKVPEGFPEPTGDTLGDWIEMGRVVEKKNKPLVFVIDALASGFNYNFPRLGENKKFDRVINLIASDGRDVKQFVSWAKANKRDPHWYHVNVDSLWGDWPRAFSSDTGKIIKADDAGGFYA
jgi:hypothetical protein